MGVVSIYGEDFEGCDRGLDGWIDGRCGEGARYL